jgi:RNA polymerase sigma factor (TIGR02999 family)
LDDRLSQDLIARWRGGDAQALKDLLPLVYKQLHRIARQHLRKQRANHTLQTTALIHEAYLRFAGAEGASVQDRSHFMALASRMMRQVLVDHARGRVAAKRQGGVRVTLSEAAGVADEVDVLGIDEALTRLSQFDEQQARVVELRFFGGLSIQETADSLHISESTVKRDWTLARMWLSRELQNLDSP